MGMSLQHRLLSTIITLAHKCADAINPRTILFFVKLQFIVFLWRRTNRSPILRAAVVGILSIVYSFVYYGGERIESFLEKGGLINEYYTANEHELHPSKTLSPRGLYYANGRWLEEKDAAKNCSDTIRFRGVNLPAKTPSAPSELRNTKNNEHFYTSKRDVSFVGRPFPLDEAPTHFQRISHQWGFNLVRLSTSWEAVMHEGPGVIDRPYLAYLQKLISLAGEHGLYVLIDPHQDVWSRFTGGDGAPYWTLEAAGFNLDRPVLHDAGSAILHQFWNASEFGDMPGMMWTNNYWKLGASTMFTLFFAGDVYAPGIIPETSLPYEERSNETIQMFLQGHYLQFIDAVAEAMKDCPNVIGFGTMNEPSNGFVGVEDIREIHSPVLHGHALSAFDSMRLGSGESLEVPYYDSHFRHRSQHLLNPRQKSVYHSPESDVWQRVGVYEIDDLTDQRTLLRPNHFSFGHGEDFTNTYLLPFYESVKRTVSQHNPKFVTYAEPYFDPTDPYPSAPAELAGRQFGWAPHWYDAITLFLGIYSHWFSFDFEWNVPAIGPNMIDWAFRKNLGQIKHGKEGQQSKDMHIVVGETGVPFTGGKGDYTLSLDRTLRAMEVNDLDFAVWCYEGENDDIGGDMWNGENLSLISGGRGRGLQAAIRPWPHRYNDGLRVVSQRFNPIDVRYRLVVEEKEGISCVDCVATVHIFVPSCHFREPTFTAPGDTVSYDRSAQNLEWEIRGRSAAARYVLQISDAPNS